MIPTGRGFGLAEWINKKLLHIYWGQESTVKCHDISRALITRVYKVTTNICGCLTYRAVLVVKERNVTRKFEAYNPLCQILI